MAVANTGEADESTDCEVRADWSGATLTASDALDGWSVQAGVDRAIFRTDPGRGLRLSPGTTRDIGWLRYDQITPLRLQVVAVRGGTPR